MDEEALDGRFLLRAFLDLRTMAPQLDDWNETRLDDNPPRLIRLRRLRALFKAFEIPWDPDSFIKGSFIQPHQPRYAAVLARLAVGMPEEHSSHALARDTAGFFARLYEYREQLEQALSSGRGLMEASGPYLEAHKRIDQLNRVILGNIDLIEAPLVELISPEGRVFELTHLIRDHGFPDEDLFMIDADWW